ncbi:MAG: hypothetical protein F7B20_02075 [Aeropyrum sp.]|nr:hypothetical protein [Aeropyrum sp.]MCE4616144.1 hypothetical protein [Aeropyrum sp.]
MAGVRLDKVNCLDEEVVERALYRIIQDLAEALERTPATISSKPLIEGALKLAMGAYNSSRRILESCRG